MDFRHWTTDHPEQQWLIAMKQVNERWDFPSLLPGASVNAVDQRRTPNGAQRMQLEFTGQMLQRRELHRKFCTESADGSVRVFSWLMSIRVCIREQPKADGRKHWKSRVDICQSSYQGRNSSYSQHRLEKHHIYIKNIRILRRLLPHK